VQETFSVPDVSCAHCKSAIEGALRPIDGVTEAVVDVDAKRVEVAYDENVVSRRRLIEGIDEAGYAVAG
jgi:copper chaperone